MANNSTIWKIISILVTLGVLAGGAIYGYASLNHEVEDNSEEIKEMKPIIKTHDRTIIGIQKDIEQILKTQKTMIETEKDNTKSILDAIGKVKDGN